MEDKVDIRKIFEYALQREFEGKRFFEENALHLKHAAAIDAFKKLAGEKQKHIEYINKQNALLNMGHSPDTELGETMENAGFFSARASSEMIEQTVSEAMVADLPILRMAYLIERDFSEFYQYAAREAEVEAKKVLEMLALWEHRHELLFKHMHDTDFEGYARMPWGG